MVVPLTDRRERFSVNSDLHGVPKGLAQVEFLVYGSLVVDHQVLKFFVEHCKSCLQLCFGSGWMLVLQLKDLLSDQFRAASLSGLLHEEMVVRRDHIGFLKLGVHELPVAFSIPIHVDCAACLAATEMGLDELVSEREFVEKVIADRLVRQVTL